jgi:psiF repeat
MIIRICTAIVASAALLSPAIAAEELTAQQQRMKTCNLEAKDKDLKGDQRQSFMSQCLKGGGDEKELTAQQQKMKDCNRTASERQMKGDERREFMSQCLRKDGGDQLTAQQERMKTCNRRRATRT